MPRFFHSLFGKKSTAVHSSMAAADSCGWTPRTSVSFHNLTNTAGACLTNETVFTVSALFACSDLIAKQIAGFPRAIYRTQNGKNERDDSTYLYKLLCRRPNSEQTAFEFYSQLVGWGVVFGKYYVKITFDGRGKPSALEALDPRRIEKFKDESGNIFYKYLIEGKPPKTAILLPGEVAEWESCSRAFTGKSTSENARETLGIAAAVQEFSGAHFKNAAVPAGILVQEHAAGMPLISKEQRDSLLEYWRKFIGSRNAGKTAFLDGGVKYHPLAHNFRDSQLVEIANQKTLEICSFFGVPPTLIGVMDNATYNNVENLGTQFYRTTIGPLLFQLEMNIRERIIPEQERDTFALKFNADSLLRATTKDRYDAHRVGIEAGFLTRNEVRRFEDREPISGLDDPIMPLNMQELNK